MKTKRKFCLAVIVALAVLIMAAASVYACGITEFAYADDVITKVELEIDKPVNGGTAISNIAHIKDKSEDRYYVEFTNWYDITADKDLMYSEDKFVGGHEYRVYVTVNIKGNLYPYTQFAVSALGNPDATVKVNDNLASMKKCYDRDAKQSFVIIYEFSSIDCEALTEVRIWQLDEPVTNANPDFDVTIGSNHCKANLNMGQKNGIAWYAPHINSLVGFNNYFERGYYYELQYSLEVEDGYYFTTGLQVYINGKKLESGEYGYVNQYLTITKRYLCENAKINYVEITNVDAPSWESENGTYPDYELSVGENCSLVSQDNEIYEEANLFHGVKWVNVDTGHELVIEESFEANTTYKMVCYLKADEYFDFALNGGLSAVTAKVNGELAECHPIYNLGGDYSQYLVVEYTFAPTGNTINTICISNLIEPENTDEPTQDIETIVTGAGYFLSEFTWCDEQRNESKDNFVFERTYFAFFTVWIEEGYKFNINYRNLFINGNEIGALILIEESETAISMYVPFECREKSLTELSFDIIEPVTGEYVSEDVFPKDTNQIVGEAKWFLHADYNSDPLTEVTMFENGEYGVSITLCAKDGYRFADGMEINFNGITTYAAAEFGNKMAIVTYTMYSDESYTISFNSNGGGAGSMESITFVKNGTVVELPDCDFPAPEGKRFVGWSENENGEVVDNPYTFLYSADLELFAKWEEWNEYELIEIDTTLLIGETQITLLSENNIASGSVNVVNNYWKKEGSDDILEVGTALENGRYVYLIEISEKDLHFPDFSENNEFDIVRIVGDADYYAHNFKYNKYTNTIVITIYFFCGSIISSSKYTVGFFESEEKNIEIDFPTQEKGTLFTIPNLGDGELQFSAPQGKYFFAWAESLPNDEYVLYYPGQTLLFYKDTELFAFWENIPEEHSVAFNSNGGSGEMQSVVGSGYYNLPENGFTPGAHKSFAGWAYSAEGEVIYGDTIKLDDDIILFAIWEDVLYTVTYRYNDGTDLEVPLENILAGEYTLKTLAELNLNERQGYTFAGWAFSANGEVIDGNKINVTDNTLLYAVWTTKNTEPGDQPGEPGDQPGDQPGDEPGDQPGDQPGEPEYTHNTVDGVELFEKEANKGEAVDLTEIFAAAKAEGENGRVEVTFGEIKMSFGADAINAIGGEAVTVTANYLWSYIPVEGAQRAIEVNFVGASFAQTFVTVSFDLDVEPSEGSEPRIYYVDGDNLIDMNARYVDGVISFDVQHFSTYVLIFVASEDESEGNEGGSVTPGSNEGTNSSSENGNANNTPEKVTSGGLSGGAIAGIVVGAVVVVAGGVVLALFLLRKKNGKKSKDETK